MKYSMTTIVRMSNTLFVYQIKTYFLLQLTNIFEQYCFSVFHPFSHPQQRMVRDFITPYKMVLTEGLLYFLRASWWQEPQMVLQLKVRMYQSKLTEQKSNLKWLPSPMVKSLETVFHSGESSWVCGLNLDWRCDSQASLRVHFNATTCFLCALGQTSFFLSFCFGTRKLGFSRAQMCTHMPKTLTNDKALFHNYSREYGNTSHAHR